MTQTKLLSNNLLTIKRLDLPVSVRFDHEQHKYYVADEEYISATTFLSKAMPYIPPKGIDPEKIKEAAEAAAYLGKHFHNQMERM